MRLIGLFILPLFLFHFSLRAQYSPYARVLFVGNSITSCPPYEAIEWYGAWGMAASSPETDYVHRVIESLARRQGIRPHYAILPASQFERRFMYLDIPSWLAPLDTLHPDLIVFQLGENIRPDTAFTYDLESTYKVLLDAAKTKAPAARVIALTTFWATRSIDSMITRAASSAHVTCLNISAIYTDTLNRASSERPFKDRDVGSHPGDRGMQQISQAILDIAATGVDEGATTGVPARFAMELFPNPFNGSSVIELTVAHRVPVQLRVLNLLGEIVAAQSVGILDAGTHRIPISMPNLPSGTYIVSAVLGDRSMNTKAILIR